MAFINQIEPYLTEREAQATSEYLLSGGWLTEFKQTEILENMLADFLGVKHCVLVTNGTVSLYLAMLACGLGEGDKVLVPNYTMIASPNAVKWAGAEPVLVDIEADSLCMDVDNLIVDAHTKALMYVSIDGRSGDMSKVQQFCKDNDLILVEDACQALGAKNRDTYLGTFGNVGCFSFSPHKLITTGQGGAIVTNDDAIYAKIKKLKDFHRTAPATDWHDGLGFNFKFTDLQAVVGIEQIKTIDDRIQRKKEIYGRYADNLKNTKEIEFLPTDLEQVPPWFVDPLLSSREIRDALQRHLKDKAIGSRHSYPPINHQPMYNHFEKGSFPVSEDLAYRGLWLPSSLNLTDDDIDRICTEIIKYFGRH